MSGERRSAAERKKERLRALLYLAEQDTVAAKLLAAHGNHDGLLSRRPRKLSR